MGLMEGETIVQMKEKHTLVMETPACACAAGKVS